MKISSELIPYIYLGVGGVVTIFAAVLVERWAPALKKVFWLIFILCVGTYVSVGLALLKRAHAEAARLRAEAMQLQTELADARRNATELSKLSNEDKGSREQFGAAMGRGQKSIDQLAESVSRIRSEEAQKCSADVETLQQGIVDCRAELDSCKSRVGSLTFENGVLQGHKQALDQRSDWMLEAEYWPTDADQSKWPGANKVLRKMPFEQFALLGRDKFVLYQIIAAGGSVDADKLKDIERLFNQEFGRAYDQNSSLYRLKLLGFLSSEKNDRVSLARPFTKHLREYLKYTGGGTAR